MAIWLSVGRQLNVFFRCFLLPSSDPQSHPSAHDGVAIKNNAAINSLANHIYLLNPYTIIFPLMPIKITRATGDKV